MHNLGTGEQASVEKKDGIGVVSLIRRKEKAGTDPKEYEWETVRESKTLNNDGLMYTAAKSATETTPATPASVTVGNTPGTPLPVTGGIGTNVFHLIGSSLIVAAGTLFLKKH